MCVPFAIVRSLKEKGVTATISNMFDVHYEKNFTVIMKKQHSDRYYSLLFVVHAATFVVKQQMSSASSSLCI